MTSPQGIPPRSSAAKRFGPLIGIVVVVVVVAGAVVVSGRNNNASTSDATKTVGGSVAAPADVPITYAAAKAQGKESSITWVDNCDPATGLIKMPTVYAPPCVPKYTGDNGGATSFGVTKDKVTIVVYQAANNSDLSALLEGKLDPPEKVEETT